MAKSQHREAAWVHETLRGRRGVVGVVGVVGVARYRGPRNLARCRSTAIFRYGDTVGCQQLGRFIVFVSFVTAFEQASWVERGSPLQVMLAASRSKTHRCSAPWLPAHLRVDKVTVQYMACSSSSSSSSSSSKGGRSKAVFGVSGNRMSAARWY